MPPLLAVAHRSLTLDELIRRARLGDAVGIGGLYDRYVAELYRAAFRVTASRADAEDVVHDLFVGLPHALARYQDQGHLDAWLRRMTIRLALMRLRGERRRHLAPATEACEVAASGRTDARVELSELQQTVLALPDGLRVVLVLKQVHGYSHDEIGGMLGISAGASRVRLSRALETLRRSLR